MYEDKQSYLRAVFILPPRMMARGESVRRPRTTRMSLPKNTKVVRGRHSRSSRTNLRSFASENRIGAEVSAAKVCLLLLALPIIKTQRSELFQVQTFVIPKEEVSLYILLSTWRVSDSNRPPQHCQCCALAR